jgi:hypothetical protein
MSKIDPKADRERILDCIKLGERMSPHFVMDLLEALEGERNHVALLKASLNKATETEHAALARVAALEEFAANFVRQIEEFETWDKDDWDAAMSGLRGFAETARAALSSTERMPSDGTP